MNFDWYPWYIQKYRRNTSHLSLAEDGAYRRLIDEYMMTRAPLLDNDVALARIVGVSKDEWLILAVAVRAFFEASNGKLINRTCEEELNAQVMQVQCTRMKKQAAANSRWSKVRELKEIHARALQMQSTSNASAMQNDATRQSKKEKEPEVIRTARLLATALPAGALARSPISEIGAKRPSDVSRSELEARFAAKREQKAN